jgi:hypothetical protein
MAAGTSGMYVSQVDEGFLGYLMRWARINENGCSHRMFNGNGFDYQIMTITGIKTIGLRMMQ